MKTTAAVRPAAALRGSLVFFAILAALATAFALPVCLVASLAAQWGAPLWVSLVLGAVVGIGELYLVVFIPDYLDRRGDDDEAGAEPTRTTAWALRRLGFAKDDAG